MSDDERLINDDLLMIRGFWSHTYARIDGQRWLLSRYRDWKAIVER